MGHLVNPITFRLGRSLFWSTNKVQNNRINLKKNNFLISFVLKIIYWLFTEKFSLNFFFYRYRTYKKISYTLFVSNLKNFNLHKSKFNFNLLKIILKLKFNFNFNFIIFYKAKLNFSSFNILKESLLDYYQSYLFNIHYFSHLYLLKYSNIIHSNYLLKFFIEFFKNKTYKFDIFFRFYKTLNYQKIKYLTLLKNNYKFFDTFLYFYLNVFLKKHLNKNIKINSIYQKKKIFTIKYIYSSLIFRLINLKNYILFMDRFQNKLTRKSLRFLKLEITDLQLFFMGNKIKINIICFKETLFKNFFFRLKKNIYKYLCYRWQNKLKIIIKNKFNFLLKNLNIVFQILNFLNKNDIKLLLTFFILKVKKILILLTKLKIKNLFFLNVFFFKFKIYSEIINKKYLNLKVFNLNLIQSQSKLILDRLFKNLFFNHSCSTYFLILENTILNAYVVFKFIQKQLLLQKSLGVIMKIVYSELIKYHKFKGFKILLKGRFTRKERAFKRVWNYGKIPLSTIIVPVDYYSNFFISKFGVGSIRIWLFKEI